MSNVSPRLREDVQPRQGRYNLDRGDKLATTPRFGMPFCLKEPDADAVSRTCGFRVHHRSSRSSRANPPHARSRTISHVLCGSWLAPWSSIEKQGTREGHRKLVRGKESGMAVRKKWVKGCVVRRARMSLGLRLRDCARLCHGDLVVAMWQVTLWQVALSQVALWQLRCGRCPTHQFNQRYITLSARLKICALSEGDRTKIKPRWKCSTRRWISIDG